MTKSNKLFISSASLSIVIFNISPVRADENISYLDYQFYCGRSSSKTHILENNCDRFLQLFTSISPESPSGFIFYNKTKNLKYQKHSANDTGIADYLVSSVLGVYFPTLETVKPHSGGSFFGGIQLNQNIDFNAEIVGIFEGNTVEKAYFDMSTFFSLRFSIPLSHKKNDPALYFNPGIGISEIERKDESDEDTDSRPTLQIEGGIAVPIDRHLGGYGGIKYVNQPSEEGDRVFGAECGITIRL